MEDARQNASRRIGVLAQQLVAPEGLGASGSGSSGPSQLERNATSASYGSSNNNNQASTSYASIDGRPNSYARVHGEVSRAPAKWRSMPVVAKETLREVIYEKAEGEGIAKVGLFEGLGGHACKLHLSTHLHLHLCGCTLDPRPPQAPSAWVPVAAAVCVASGAGGRRAGPGSVVYFTGAAAMPQSSSSCMAREPTHQAQPHAGCCKGHHNI